MLLTTIHKHFLLVVGQSLDYSKNVLEKYKWTTYGNRCNCTPCTFSNNKIIVHTLNEYNMQNHKHLDLKHYFDIID